jgi:PadR family transcriptional regulator PadR
LLVFAGFDIGSLLTAGALALPTVFRIAEFRPRASPVPPRRLTPEFPVVFPKKAWHFDVGNPKDDVMKEKAEVRQGTLALMVLRTLEVLGPVHGYGIARRIEQISGDLLRVNQGTLYPVLLRLEQEGAITSGWGVSENNRRARFYRLTRGGRRLLIAETRDWEQAAAIMGRFLTVSAEDLK